MSTAEIDTTNKFFVASQGNAIVFLRAVPPKLSNADALLLAAYIVSMADEGDGLWQRTLDAVQST